MSDSTVQGAFSAANLSFSAQENQTNTTVISHLITGAVTVVGDDNSETPFNLSSGTAGLYFVSGTSSVGGTISITDGVNTIIGGQIGAPAGLQGPWNIATGGGQTEIWLGGGADSVVSGGADTIHAGGANVLINVTTGQGTVIDPGSGFVTFLGGASGGARIQAGGTGGGLYQLGSGGGNVAFAGTGNTTLIGGGGGDRLVANTVTGASGTVLMAGGNDTMVGGGVGTDTFFGFSPVSGNGNVLINLTNAVSGQQVWLGGGNDTVRLGGGADTVVVSAQHTDGDGADRLIGWNASQDVLRLTGYGYNPAQGNQPSMTDTAAGLNLKLTDGTSITFAGLHNASAIKISFG